VARVLGAEHHAEEVSLDLEESVLDLARTNDDLFADSSLLAVDKLCKMTRRHVTVALSGDGADDILAGYQTYSATYLAHVWRHVPAPLRALARRGADRLPTSRERYNVREFARRFLRGAERGAGADFASWRIYFDEEDRRELLRPGLPDGDALGRYARAMDEVAGATLLKQMLYADFSYYLPNDMLVKVDRASMRHGLEVRVPFLDIDLVTLCLSFPSRYLLSPRGTTKAILRNHVEQRVSRRIARGKKRGFNVPVSEAFRGALGRVLSDALASEPFRSDGPLDVDAVQARLRAHQRGDTDAGFVLYAALVLALWWPRWLSGAR
jgi:asparagine synthase (glutamine-hydrolysing)